MTDFKALAEAIARDLEKIKFTAAGSVAVKEAQKRRFSRFPEIETAFLELWARVQELEGALRITRDRLDSANHDSFDGVWSEEDFKADTREADAALHQGADQ